MGEQDEPNPLLWLATRTGYLAHLGLPAVCHKKKFPKIHILNPLLTKLVQSRWLDIGRFTCEFMDFDSVSVHHTQKEELGQYPAILTLRLVNNPYLPTSSLYLAHVDSVKLPFFS